MTDSHTNKPRVMIFIDAMNLKSGEDEFTKIIKRIFKVDIIRLIEYISQGRRYGGAFYFRGKAKNPNAIRAKKILEDFGIDVREYPRQEYTGKEKEVDVALATMLIEKGIIKEKYDIGIVVSGDRDFRPAIDCVKRYGKKVEIVTFKDQISRRMIGFAKKQNVKIWYIDDFYKKVELGNGG